MPNWCENTLYIKGDNENLRDFIAKVKNSPEQAECRNQDYDILGNLYPTPEELTDTVSGWSNDPEVQAEREKRYEANQAKYGYSNWYDWNNSNWGSKWGDCDTYLALDDDDSVEFRFLSAWSPPIEGIAKVATMFPKLQFAVSYVEPGMGFYGFTSFDSDGNCFDTCEKVEDLDAYNNIDFDDDDSWEKAHEIIMDARDNLATMKGW